jgi:hypothetical protein
MGQLAGFEPTGGGLALIVFALVFVSAVLGLALQSRLPEPLVTGGSRDMSGAVVGLLTLLLALVLGLLIWTAFGVYSTQKGSIQTLAVNVLKVDNALHAYGDEASEGRTLLRDLARRAVEHVWHPEEDVTLGYVHALSGGEKMRHYLDGLQPSTDQQKAAKADALAAAATLVQTRLSMALGLNDPVSYPLLWLVVTWAMALFFGYGFLSKPTPTAFAMAAVGALAIASAIYAIDDLSSPYQGLFQISSQPIRDVLTVVDALARRAGGQH